MKIGILLLFIRPLFGITDTSPILANNTQNLSFAGRKVEILIL